MKIEIIGKMKVLTPDEGKILMNGEVTSECVYMLQNADESEWWEIEIDKD